MIRLSLLGAGGLLATGCGRGKRTAESDVIEVRVVTIYSEYESQERQIWDLFEQEHPGIKIRLRSVTEGPSQDALDAATAAGDPPDDLILYKRPTREDYRHFVNLNEIDFPWWDKYAPEVRDNWSRAFGVDGVRPFAPLRYTEAFSFIYHSDEFRKAGLDPSHSIRTLDDLRSLLAAAKAYVDRTPGVEHVWDMAWHPWVIGEIYAIYFACAHGGDLGAQQAVFHGDISWTDEARNPFTKFFTFLKESYDAGYIPREWWLREWEADMETSFIGRKSMLVFHGPWIWEKTLAQDPSAMLEAFPLPAGPDGRMGGREIDLGGPAIFAKARERANWPAVKQAFDWHTSPRSYKLHIEQIYGAEPVMDVADLGPLEIGTPQYVKFAGPYRRGEWFGWTWDWRMSGNTSVERYRKPGSPYVLFDNSNRRLIGEYCAGRIPLGGVLETLQKRWETSYPGLSPKGRA